MGQKRTKKKKMRERATVWGRRNQTEVYAMIYFVCQLKNQERKMKSLARLSQWLVSLIKRKGHLGMHSINTIPTTIGEVMLPRTLALTNVKLTNQVHVPISAALLWFVKHSQNFSCVFQILCWLFPHLEREKLPLVKPKGHACISNWFTRSQALWVMDSRE